MSTIHIKSMKRDRYGYQSHDCHHLIEISVKLMKNKKLNSTIRFWSHKILTHKHYYYMLVAVVNSNKSIDNKKMTITPNGHNGHKSRQSIHTNQTA